MHCFIMCVASQVEKAHIRLAKSYFLIGRPELTHCHAG